HALLSLDSFPALEGHSKLGASWEGFALEQVLRLAGERDAFFWATHGGAELDLMVFNEGKRFGFEFKYTDAPTLTRSMHIALDDLKLGGLLVVYPGKQAYKLQERIEVVPIEQLPGKVPRRD